MLVKNCKIISSKGLVSGDILIENGRIKEIKKNINKRDEEVVNARGKPVIPGLVDAHTHMRDFKEKQKEDFISGTKAALAGGITTIIDMPNTNPPITSAETFNRRIKTANKSSLVDFDINFGISDNMGEIDKVKPASYKIYMDGALGDVSEILEHAFKKCSQISVHAEDSKTISRNIAYVKDRDDFLSHADIREPKAEIDAIKRACELAERYKTKTHICHISSRKSLRYLNSYTTSEVTPHHLFLTEGYLRKFKGYAKTDPP